MYKIIFISFFLGGISSMLYAQNVIKGRVLDGASLQPLKQATVLNLQNGIGTTTNDEGYFSLRTSSFNDSLQFSFLGYQRSVITVSVFNQMQQVIKLMPTQQDLQEITVSSGYQQLKQKDLTGSFEQLDSAKLSRSTSPNFLSRIEGLVTSVDFDHRAGNDTKFSIRGLSTLSDNSSSPLIVLDNFPYQGDLKNINPEDIESVTLLKDAAAAAIWGVGAANGVLVITTKKGRLNSAVRINYSASYSVTQKPDLFKIPTIATSDFLSFEKQLFDLGVYNSALENTSDRPVVSPYIEMLSGYRNGEISEQMLQNSLANFSKADVRSDFEKYVYRPAQATLHNLNLSGGTTKSAHSLNVAYTLNQAVLKGNDLQRINLHTDNTYKPFKFVELNLGVFYTHSKNQNNTSGGYGSIYPGGGKSTLYPYARLAGDNGGPAAVPKDVRLAYTDTAGNGNLYDWGYRPLQELVLNDNTSETNAIILRTGMKLNLLQGLNIEARFQYENSNSTNQNLHSQNSYFVRNLVNRYSNADANSVTRNIPFGAILDGTPSGYRANSGRLQLNYQKYWGKDHHLNFIAGAEQRSYQNHSNAYRYYGYNADILTSSPVDYRSSFPIYGNLSSDENIPNIDDIELTTSHNVSLYSAAYYTYADRYTLSTSLRRDASNLFGASTNNKWQPLWSAGFGWNLSNEAFYKKTDLPDAKIRLSYGYTGNVNGNVSAYTIITYRPAAIGGNSLTGLPNANITGIPNPDLKWENTRIINAGIDLNGKVKRWSFTADIYTKRSDDLIGLRPADPTLGGSTAEPANTAALNTKGIDLNFLYPIVRNSDFRWDMNLLASWNSNRVKKYLYQPTLFSSYIGDGSLINPVLGQSAYNIGSYKWKGLDLEGDPTVSSNGEISKDYSNLIYSLGIDDITFSGSALPTFFGAYRNDLYYGKWALSFNISWKAGYYYRRPSISYYGLALWQGHPDYALRWQQPGDEMHTTVPRFKYPLDSDRDQVYANSDVLVEPADHIRLKDIRLSYRLKPSTHFSQTEFFVYGSDLGLLWKASGYPTDPEYSLVIAPGKTFSIGFKTNIN